MSVILYSQNINQPNQPEEKKGCGCGVGKEPPAHIKNMPMVPSAKTKAAMCQTCPFASRGANGGAIGCSLDNKPLANIIGNPHASCPEGRFAAGTNMTQWVGLTFAGVPEPLRWSLTWQKKRNVELDGCGCIMAVKGSSFGPYLEPFFEGISQLRQHFGNFLSEFSQVVRGTTATVAE